MYDFNPYNPYNSYIATQQRFGNQMMNQPPMMQSQPQQAGIGVAQVPTIEHVEQVQMTPGEMKIVLIQNNPNYMAIRVADRAGFVSTHIVDPKTLKTVQQYAPIESVAVLRDEIEQLKRMIGGVANEPNAKHAVREEQSGNE